MTHAPADLPPPEDAPVRGLRAVERALRRHSGVVAAISAGAIMVIFVTQLRPRSEVWLAVTCGIPLALCAYSAGLMAGIAMAIAVSLLSGLDLAVLGRSDLASSLVSAAPILSSRLLANSGIAVIAALLGNAARTRERYLGIQESFRQLRTEVMAAFSHDLRTPLAAISGYADLLHDELADHESPEITRTLAGIQVNTRHLERLINDMLGVEQSEGTSPLRISAFGAETFLTELREEFAEELPKRPVTLYWQVEPHTPELQTDRVKLTSIVRNLVSNALKFTPRGSVSVRLTYQHKARLHCIEVEDTGPGIPAEALPHIFERFYRASDSRARAGFGLGLFIVKRFTELLGGTVEVESDPGSGARFTVRIPRLPARNGIERAPGRAWGLAS